MLHPNRQFFIPSSHGATKVIHLSDNRPTAAFTPEFGVVFCKNLADFANLVCVGNSRPFHDSLHDIFDNAMRWYFTFGRIKQLVAILRAECLGLAL
ncbi:hypothetical protein I8752_22245 [Nostocaceae cyanobacterium CENA369]|uniref:Uncharacterized protein n=1 Tax=Dendronalium phyllosphericum CENA369 TaxID=1725256 RepID=A0A8J7LF67_9NOST|nr:hypothetical protein [Dendronalium phyllosphericum]MBH8575677.1 hypothetical protein [Dendronalium phyllosphericum CENA369]